MRSTIRRIGAIGCAGALVVLLAAPVAMAGYKPGRYAGETSQGESIAFKAKKHTVKAFSFTVLIECEDDSAFELSNSEGQAPTNGRGKFRAVFSGDATTVLKGKLKRKKASGTFESEGTAPTGARCYGHGDWSASKG
jgi:hypothetical protein